MTYNKPFFEEINTEDLCDYGCNTKANFIFRNGKKCCSKHHNSCPGKREKFSKLDHSERTRKSLETRTKLGITKTSQIKGAKTRKKNGFYERLASKMQEHWENNPWENNPKCRLVSFKNTDLNYQGTYEYEFLEELESEYGLTWLLENVRRGPSVWYIDPVTDKKRLYISDFIIGNTIYEIKSSWTWNKKGKDMNLEQKNKAKLQQCINEGYEVNLILNGKKENWL